ncbi:MAG: acetyl xylan esterase [Deltaproteobacteria bacterium]|nr:acetyl xylan esterase [Deltaproteobacteria bacterium]MBN2670390.1 acetyl xylan esterase [Deltaproteobacteria bacterium]
MKTTLLLLLMALMFIMGCGEGNSDNDPTDTSTDSDTGNPDGTDDSDTTGSTDDSDLAVAYADNVCGFSEPVTLGAVEADGMVLVPPSHPDINYFGRVDCTNPTAISMAFPGVSIRAKFTGTAIGMVYDDHGDAVNPNFFNIIIDGGEPTVQQMTTGESTYELAGGLAAGEHTIELFKRNESNSGTGMGIFLGLRINDGEQLLPIEARPNRIEFIGDSITCGYGNMIETDDPDSYHFTTTNSNAYESWASITARALDAEVSIVAYSGRGAYRNYGGGGGETVPEMYLDCLPDTTIEVPWNIEQFTPQVVVVNLGTNDMSEVTADTLDSYQEGYAAAMEMFVETLRGYYPDSTIVLAVGPMLYSIGLTAVRTVCRELVDARVAAGDANIYFLNIPGNANLYGEDWHPTAATHAYMSGLLVELLTDKGVMPL